MWITGNTFFHVMYSKAHEHSPGPVFLLDFILIKWESSIFTLDADRTEGWCDILDTNKNGALHPFGL